MCVCWRVGACKGMGCVVEKSPGNISSELKVQAIHNQTCTEYKPHGPFLYYNSYWTKSWSIFGVFLKGHGVCCNILYLSKEQYIIILCFDPDDLYKALTGAQAQKKYRARSHLLHEQRHTEKSAWKLPMQREMNVSCKTRDLVASNQLLSTCHSGFATTAEAVELQMPWWIKSEHCVSSGEGH